MRLSLRRASTAALVTLLPLVPLAVLPAAPVAAVVASAPVSFSDCEVLRDDVRLPGETSWRPTLTLDHPSPVPTASAQTFELVVSSLPAGTFPEDYPSDVNLYVTVEFEDGRGGTIEFAGVRPLASFDADAPLVVGEFETDLTFFSSGIHDLEPKSIEVELFGVIDQDTFDFVDYVYECDQNVDPAPLSQVRVFDPEAAATIRLDRAAVQQGGALVISGQDFDREPVQDPDADVEVFVGSLRAGRFDVDDIGSFSGVLRIPEYARPGSAVVIRTTQPGETATATVALRVKSASATVTSSARSGATVAVRGARFRPGETARVLLTTTSRSSGTKRYAVSVRVGSAGTFAKSVRLTRAAKGTWRVTVTGPSSYRTARAALRVR